MCKIKGVTDLIFFLYIFKYSQILFLNNRHILCHLFHMMECK